MNPNTYTKTHPVPPNKPIDHNQKPLNPLHDVLIHFHDVLIHLHDVLIHLQKPLEPQQNLVNDLQ